MEGQEKGEGKDGGERFNLTHPHHLPHHPLFSPRPAEMLVIMLLPHLGFKFYKIKKMGRKN